jgi:hypothetical protein
MPTAGTDITLIERLALDPKLKPLLGDPLADETDPAGLQMRYAKTARSAPIFSMPCWITAATCKTWLIFSPNIWARSSA